MLVGNLDRPNIFICKSKRRPSSLGAESYNDTLLPIAEGVKSKLIDYPLTIVYLPLKWCGYAFNFFLDVLREKSYFLENCVRSPENCLFAQYHAPQTDRKKDEILQQLTGSSKESLDPRCICHGGYRDWCQHSIATTCYPFRSAKNVRIILSRTRKGRSRWQTSQS